MVSVERQVALERYRPPPARRKARIQRITGYYATTLFPPPPAPAQHQCPPPKPLEADQTPVPAETLRGQEAKPPVHDQSRKVKSPGSMIKGVVICEENPIKQNTTKT